MIDLDLVKLRAEVRGWPWDDLGADLVVRAPHGVTVLVSDLCRPLPTEQWVWDLLTAPRWTLDRLIEQPPEGWVVSAGPYRYGPKSEFYRLRAELAHGTTGARVKVNLCATGRLDVKPDTGSWGKARKHASAARAVAELLAILAEVEP